MAGEAGTGANRPGAAAAGTGGDQRLAMVAHAVRRYGLGPRPGEAAEIASDPRGAVIASIEAARRTEAPKPVAEVGPSPLLTGRDALLTTRLSQVENNVLQRVASAAPASPDAMTRKPNDVPGPLYRVEIGHRFARAVASRAPLVERLVWFWSNHFSVSAAKDGLIRAVVGAYEREAIRPHVLGRFRDMLGAATLHPAMLIYLDNRQSVSADSVVGRWKTRGLNENLARELLELHTLGVDGGYSQADVTNLARILTGWTVSDVDQHDPAWTVFVPFAHEPGPTEVLGRTYGGDPAAQIGLVLDDLARHPSTARYLSRRLVQHFLGPEPRPELVARLAKLYLATDGNLGELTLALLKSWEGWQPAAARVLPPWDFTVATARAIDQDLPLNLVLRAMDVLGQKVWEPPSPKGWLDDEDWGGSGALLARLDWSEDIGRRYAAQRDVKALSEALAGPYLSAETRLAVGRAETRQQALALLLMSPEMQTR
jgi:uncharacterized protein (DUF1800 family)